jgi:hypothetical protein
LTQLLKKKDLRLKPWRYFAKGFFGSYYEVSPGDCAAVENRVRVGNMFETCLRGTNVSKWTGQWSLAQGRR